MNTETAENYLESFNKRIDELYARANTAEEKGMRGFASALRGRAHQLEREQERFLDYLVNETTL